MYIFLFISDQKNALCWNSTIERKIPREWGFPHPMTSLAPNHYAGPWSKSGSRIRTLKRLGTGNSLPIKLTRHCPTWLNHGASHAFRSNNLNAVPPTFFLLKKRYISILLHLTLDSYQPTTKLFMFYPTVDLGNRPVDFGYHLTVTMTCQVQSPLKEHYKRSRSERLSDLTSSSSPGSCSGKGDSDLLPS